MANLTCMLFRKGLQVVILLYHVGVKGDEG